MANSKKRKSLVIDACVLRAAGSGQKTNRISSSCKKFLDAVLNVCHKAALNDELAQEWKRHKSRSATKWLASMRARKKLDRGENFLPDAVLEAVRHSPHADVLKKDLHLIEVALHSDGIIVSCDNNARDAFKALQLSDVSRLIWIDPCTACVGELVEWLERGAPRKKEWELGYEEVTRTNKGTS